MCVRSTGTILQQAFKTPKCIEGAISDVLHPGSCLNRLWRGAVATVLPLGYRGRSLHLVAPHTDARERDLNKNQRRVIHALLTPLDPNYARNTLQQWATQGKKLLTYAGFAILCNAQQPLTAHS